MSRYLNVSHEESVEILNEMAINPHLYSWQRKALEIAVRIMSLSQVPSKPRFTPEEREAMDMVCKNYFGEYGFDEEREKAITAVQVMLLEETT